MEELMLHVLDIAMNSVAAGARCVKISISEQPVVDRLTLCVADNGRGMSAELVEQVTAGYATTKQKAKGWVGYGLALLSGTCDLVGGELRLLSRLGQGTLVTAVCPASHWDLPPLGPVAESLQPLLIGCTGVDLCFTHRWGTHGYRLDTRTVRRVVGAEAYGTRSVQSWMMDQVRQGEDGLAAEKRGLL